MKKPERKKKRLPRLPRLRYDFNKAVREARADHPKLKKDAVYIDAHRKNWLQDVAHQQPALAANDDAVEDLEEAVEAARSLRSSFCQAVEAGRRKTPVSAVVLHQDRHPLYDPKDRAIDDIGTFDHETAHALHTDAKGTLGENTADAYAVLRHLQRFDGQETDIDYCGWKRALVFMTSGVTTHLTTFAVDKILIDAQTADFVSLTPRQTAAIARDYAEAYAPQGRALKKLKDDFAPLKGKKMSAATFRQLAQITLAAPEKSQTFYLGARVLSAAFRDGKATLDGKTVKFSGPQWEKLEKQLDEKIAKLPQNHDLRKAAGFGT
ncbi:MAG: hypothetical protein GC185_09775 [Alphaproteobacteria bacterium]|nr:hypothetical protein [Alphaproteobacteria bacterium]